MSTITIGAAIGLGLPPKRLGCEQVPAMQSSAHAAVVYMDPNVAGGAKRTIAGACASPEALLHDTWKTD